MRAQRIGLFVCAGLGVMGVMGAAAPASAQATLETCTGVEQSLRSVSGLDLDDGSGLVNIVGAFPAGIPIGGDSYSALYININGNVSFGSTYGPVSFGSLPHHNFPVLAAFLADVDLRDKEFEQNPGDITICDEPLKNRIMITWKNVPYYDATLDTTDFNYSNSFQIILTDVGTGECTVGGIGQAAVEAEFRYGDLWWHAGTYHGAEPDGLCAVPLDGCFPAVAGVDYGDQTNAYEFSWSGTDLVDLGLMLDSNVGEEGVYRVLLTETAPSQCGDTATQYCEDCDSGGESATCNDDCSAASCGDGVLNATAGEACDDGVATANCDSDCTAPMCGDGLPNMAAGEACDTSGQSATCNANCTLSVCGDGTLNIDDGEECDDTGESADCNIDCSDSECGDGVLNTSAGEDCDGGGQSPTCDANCTSATCGDGILNTSAGEQCDDSGESAACNNDCTTSTCGDGVLNSSAGEECDGMGESDTCDADCTAATCGDGVRNTAAGEACDEGGESANCNVDCTTAGCGDGVLNSASGEECDPGEETGLCDNDCTAAACGDGVHNAAAGEACDAGGESANCNADCTASACGDGIINAAAGEACDDGNSVADDGCAANCTIELPPDNSNPDIVTPPSKPSAKGCSTSGGAGSWMWMLVALVIGRRRRSLLAGRHSTR